MNNFAQGAKAQGLHRPYALFVKQPSGIPHCLSIIFPRTAIYLEPIFEIKKEAKYALSTAGLGVATSMIKTCTSILAKLATH